MAYNYAGGGQPRSMSFMEDAADSWMGKDRYRVQTGQYDPTRADQERAQGMGARNQQQELAQAIQNRAMGRGGPSVAELQGQRGLGQAQQAAAQQAASGRGVDRAAAFRQAQNAQAQMQSQSIADTSMLRAQEQIAAQQLGAQTNQGIRGQDLEGRGISAQEGIAQLQAQTAAEQTRAQQASANAERGQKGVGAGLMAVGGLISDIRAKQDIQPLQLTADPWAPAQRATPAAGQGGQGALAQMNAKQLEDLLEKEKKPTYTERLGGGLMQAGKMLSDRESKEKIARLSAALEESRAGKVEGQLRGGPPIEYPNLAPVRGYSYEYKPEAQRSFGQPPGRQVGPMAQDLEKSPLYAGAVTDVNGLKAVDPQKVTMANTAALGEMDKRLRDIELAKELKKSGADKVEGKLRGGKPVEYPRPKAAGR